MPNTPGRKGITISETLKAELLDYQKIHKYKSPSFTKFVNELLQDIVRKDEIIKPKFPHLSVIGYDDNVLHLRDTSKPNNLVEIRLKNHKLGCNIDGMGNCDHIQFTLTLPSVAKLDIKQPK